MSKVTLRHYICVFCCYRLHVFYLSFSVATFQLWLRPPHCCSFYVTQLDTDTVGLLWTSHQLVKETAAYATNTTSTSMPSSAFEPAVSGIWWLQTCALVRTATGIGQFTFLCSVTIISTIALIILPWRSVPGPPHYQGFAITLRHTTVCRTSLALWSAQRIGLYLTTHVTHNTIRTSQWDSNPQSQQASGRRLTP